MPGDYTGTIPLETLTKTTLSAKSGDTTIAIAPKTYAEQVLIANTSGDASTVEAEIVSLRSQVTQAIDAGVHFKGTVSSTVALPTVGYKAGWQYSVQEAGTYAGKICEVGDLILCIKDYASGSASNSDWSVLQANIVGAVTGPAESVAQHVVVFTDTSGKNVKDSGFTIGVSVPAGAKFTDTTYSPATAESDGLMTAAQFSKLAGIEAGADKTDADNVKAAGAFMKSVDTLDSVKDSATYVRMTPAERTKLSGVTAGAEPNQNAFAKVKVGSTTITAGAKQDTLEIEAGEGVTLTVDATAKKVTLKETYIDSCVVQSLDNVPANLRDGGLIVKLD